jgi:hypothetical protein
MAPRPLHSPCLRGRAHNFCVLWNSPHGRLVGSSAKHGYQAAHCGPGCSEKRSFRKFGDPYSLYLKKAHSRRIVLTSGTTASVSWPSRSTFLIYPRLCLTSMRKKPSDTRPPKIRDGEPKIQQSTFSVAPQARFGLPCLVFATTRSNPLIRSTYGTGMAYRIWDSFDQRS